MNRECPSSPFTFPSEFQGSHRSLERLNILDIQHLTLTADLPHQPRQDLARPNLYEPSHAFIEHLLDRFAPADWRCDLPKQCVSSFGAAGYQFSIDVRDQRNLQIREFSPGEQRRKPLGGRFHQLAVKRRAHRKHHRALRTLRFRQFNRAFDCRSVPGDDCLVWRVDVGRSTDAAIRSLSTYRVDHFNLYADQGRHRALARRHGFLHIQPALSHGSKRVVKLQRTRGYQRRVFAERMTRYKICSGPSSFESSQRRDRTGQNRGLRVYRQPQLFIRTLEAQTRQSNAKYAIRFLKYLPGNWQRVCQLLTHSDLLRALAWKYERCSHSPWSVVNSP